MPASQAAFVAFGLSCSVGKWNFLLGALLKSSADVAMFDLSLLASEGNDDDGNPRTNYESKRCHLGGEGKCCVSAPKLAE